jgi:4-amino-4-deoxy-L-arabinose transferase-like glycosyltransferase
VAGDDRVPCVVAVRHAWIRNANQRRFAYLVVAAAAILPRLVVLLTQRGAITAAYVDKGSIFARTFVEQGTYGFIPGHPSAYTQPLYGFFLIPPYWAFGTSWVVVGTAHLVVAAATALLVYEVGRRVVSPLAGLLAALATTLHPYLIWHDMHMNREILDHFLAAALVLAVLVAVDRRSWGWAALAGAIAGVAILGNVRLAALPLLLGVYVLWQNRRTALVPAVALVVAAVAVVSPWVVRNGRSVGCYVVTTDGRALWKANNVNTLETLRAGKWIDNVPGIPGAPLTPQDAGAIYAKTGRVVPTDECAQMRFYQRKAFAFMRDRPGEKATLAAWGAKMLWQPSVTKTADRSGSGTWLDTLRSSAEPVFMIALYLLGAIGLFLAPRRFAVLTVLILAYNTLAAMVFVGETRYRTPWDFLIAVLASAAVVALMERRRSALRDTAARSDPHSGAPRMSSGRDDGRPDPSPTRVPDPS